MTLIKLKDVRGKPFAAYEYLTESGESLFVINDGANWLWCTKSQMTSAKGHHLYMESHPDFTGAIGFEEN